MKLHVLFITGPDAHGPPAGYTTWEMNEPNLSEEQKLNHTELWVGPWQPTAREVRPGLWCGRLHLIKDGAVVDKEKMNYRCVWIKE